MKKYFVTSIILSFSLMLTGCFDWLNSANKTIASTNTESLITTAHFAGAISATNKVTGVLLRWAAVTDPSLVKAYNIYRVTGSKKTLLSSLAPSLTSYMDGTVVWGTIYTYQVKAVDINGVEDPNSVTVKALSWAGISSVTAASRSSLTVTLANPATVVDEVRIYGQLGIGGTKTLLATGSGSDLEIPIAGLRTGYTYIISAQAYIRSLGKEDGNDVAFSVATMTVGYDTDGSESPRWANVMQVRAFGESPAAPKHPSVPDSSPQSRIVELVFNSFSSAGASAKYVVTRALDGNVMDSSTTTSCTDTTTTACLVCSNLSSSNGVIVCRDTQVAPSPAKYRYSLSITHVDSSTGDTWIEPLPTEAEKLEFYSVLVPIPPKNMVLVQRDAANYEMCLQLNKNPDPNRHNRCLYSGVGAVPYSTGNNKPPLAFDNGYYDFGYNLFVDRWQMACNWTMASQGGMCGPNHTPGDCIGYDGLQGNPLNTQGKVGDVWYRMTGSASPTSGNVVVCFIATSANADGTINWNYAGDLGLNPVSFPNASSQLNKAYTNDPGYYDSTGTLNTNLPGKRGKAIFKQNAATSDLICKSNVDPNYGPKRLPRMREHVVYTGPALLSGELYTAGSYANFANKYLASGGAHPNTYGVYQCDHGTATPQDTFPTNFTDMLDHNGHPEFDGFMSFKNSSNNFYYGGVGSKAAFAIGAVNTVDCQSRYGVQDPMENYVTSDAVTYNPTTFTSTGIMSPFDNGNRDLLADLSGGSSGYVFNNSTYDTSSGLSYSNSILTAFVPTLGVPIISSSFSSDYLARAQIMQPYGLNFTMPYSAAYGAGNLYVIMQNRWSPIFREGLNSGSDHYVSGRTRCVLPAE